MVGIMFNMLFLSPGRTHSYPFPPFSSHYPSGEILLSLPEKSGLQGGAYRKNKSGFVIKARS